MVRTAKLEGGAFHGLEMVIKPNAQEIFVDDINGKCKYIVDNDKLVFQGYITEEDRCLKELYR